MAVATDELPQDPNFLEQFGDFLFGGGAQGLAGLGLLTGAYNRLGGVGERGLGLGQSLAEQQMAQSSFRPYTVTTATGGQFGTQITPFERSYVDPTTGETRTITEDRLSTTMTMSPEEQAFRNQLFGGAGQFYQQAAVPTGQREAEVFERMRAVQRPEEERQRLALEERLASQGRLGLRTAQFGGAPEQFAMAQAQEEARNRAMLSAMQQAQAEQMQQTQIGQQFLAGSYVPQAQLLSALTPGMTAAGQAQQAQLYGTGLFGEASASGIDALLGAALGQGNLMGAAGTGLLSGLFANPESTAQGSRSNPLRDLYDYITGG